MSSEELEARYLPANIRKVGVVETVGSLLLTAIGTRAVINAVPGSPWPAITFGLVVLVWAIVFGANTGAHLNAVITAGHVAVLKMFSWVGTLYFAFNVAGGVLGSLLVRLISDHTAVTQRSLGAATQPPGTHLWESMVAEFAGPALFAFVVLATVLNEQVHASVAPFAVAITLGGVIWLAGPYSGGAVNPGRELGPLLVSGKFFEGFAHGFWKGVLMMGQYLLVYVVLPLMGGVVGALASEQVFDGEPPVED